MEVLELPQVVADDDEMQALLVLDLEVAHRPAVLSGDLEAQLPALARRQVCGCELQCQAVGAGREPPHGIGLRALAVLGGLVLVLGLLGGHAAVAPAVTVGGDRLRDQDGGAEDGRRAGDERDQASREVGMVAALVEHGVPLPAGDQPAVDRERHDARHDERDGQGAPEQHVADAGVHGAGDGEHERVVHDLHDRDAEGVGGERDRNDGGERQAGAQQRQARERVAE
jgi:hypothetical protein